MTNDTMHYTCKVCKRILHFDTPEDVIGYPVDGGDNWVCSRKCLEQMNSKKEEVKAIRELDKAATKEYAQFMRENPNAFPTDNKAWLTLTDEVRDRTKALFVSITNSNERLVSGYIPHRVVGDYVVFIDTAAGGQTGMGMRSGNRDFLAVHIKTGMIRKEYFERNRDPFNWWLNLIKIDDGTANEDEWKEIMRKDSMRRMFERLGIEQETK